MAGPRRYMSANDAATAEGHGKHWTNEERSLRILGEVKADPQRKIMAPKWLTDKKLREDFYRICKDQQNLNVGFCDTDGDFLAWYLISKQEFNDASVHVREALDAGDAKALKSWVKTRNVIFTQAKVCAHEIGLTIDSRCNLVRPASPKPEDNPLEALRQRMLGG